MNTFGGASQGLQFPLVDPKSVRFARERFRRDKIDLLDRANSLCMPAGRWPARGWVLLSRREYNQLSSYATNLQLNIDDSRKPNNVATIKNLAIVQAECVTRGLASDLDAIYLIEITDGRGILENEWFQFPTTTSYNIRSPAYPDDYYEDTLDSGSVWTWSTMLEDLWTQMGTFLGTWPGLPSAPAGTPEGIWLPGVPAWSALSDILDQLGMVVACDLTQDSPYTIVNDGDADAAFTALQTRYVTNLEDDLEWIDTGAGRVPKTINVLFRRRNEIYSSEETVRRDTLQWATTPLYQVTVTAPAEFADAVGTHFIWSDFTVRYDQDGIPLAADTVTATAIAAERVTQYFDRIYSRTAGSMNQTYAGALPFATGSLVDGVRWSMDHKRDRTGWITEIVRGKSPPWPDYYR